MHWVDNVDDESLGGEGQRCERPRGRGTISHPGTSASASETQARFARAGDIVPRRTIAEGGGAQRLPLPGIDERPIWKAADRHRKIGQLQPAKIGRIDRGLARIERVIGPEINAACLGVGRGRRPGSVERADRRRANHERRGQGILRGDRQKKANRDKNSHAVCARTTT